MTDRFDRHVEIIKDRRNPQGFNWCGSRMGEGGLQFSNLCSVGCWNLRRWRSRKQDSVFL